VAACEQGRSVRFTTVAALVNELMEARDERELSRVVGRWSRVDLVICDELGYVSVPASGAELLFQVLAQRSERGSVIVTTNLPFSEWTAVFSDPRLCKAAVERLTFRSHIVQTGTDSYRFKRSLARTLTANGAQEDPS
jgi:DNA replication protein DnaC